MYKIVFSATGRTERTADIFCSVFENVDKIDLSSNNFEKISLEEKDFCLIAAPVYGGRIPHCAVENLAKISGSGAKAVVMAVYGNRAYDDALAELKAAAEKSGFRVCGALAAVAQHLLLTAVAADRPDAQDARQLKEFALKMLNITQINDFEVPGNIPQGKAAAMPVHPKATANCVGCGVCAEKCPAKAIPAENPALTDNSRCITCMRCVEICPQGARKLLPAVLAVANPVMKKVWGKHTENQYYC